MKFKEFMNEKKVLNMKVGKLSSKKEIKKHLLSFLSDGNEFYGSDIITWGSWNTVWKRSDVIKENLRLILKELEQEGHITSQMKNKMGYKHEVRVYRIK